MAETLTLPKTKDKAGIYQALLPQLEALVKDEADSIANMANIAAALKAAFNFFWVGFYRVVGRELVLGPFQGPVACTRIPFGKGVCGAAWELASVVNVPDVDRFPGHIACNSASRSEIVIPLAVGGEVKLVLDIDSDKLNDFGPADEQYLPEIVNLLAEFF